MCIRDRHNAAGFDGAVNVVAQGHIVGVGQVLHMEEGFGLLHAGFGQSSGLALFVHDIIAVDLLLLSLIHIYGAGAAAPPLRAAGRRVVCRQPVGGECMVCLLYTSRCV